MTRLVLAKRCAAEACNTHPTYGKPGTKTPKFCAKHAASGEMVNVIGKRCLHEGCTKTAAYGAAGLRKSEFCRSHAPEGYVNINYKSCRHAGCTSCAAFGEWGSSTPEFCKLHAPERMTRTALKGWGDRRAWEELEDVDGDGAGACSPGADKGGERQGDGERDAVDRMISTDSLDNL
ncbi:unnamed protein product [Ectocarpus sp. 8 AP-2014]